MGCAKWWLVCGWCKFTCVWILFISKERSQDLELKLRSMEYPQFHIVSILQILSSKHLLPFYPVLNLDVQTARCESLKQPRISTAKADRHRRRGKFQGSHHKQNKTKKQDLFFHITLPRFRLGGFVSYLVPEFPGRDVGTCIDTVSNPRCPRTMVWVFRV